MSRLVALWIASLVAAAAAASALTFAQPGLREERIVTGADLGFRIEGTGRNGEPVGSVVVRIDGEWVAVGAPISVRRVN